LAVAEITVTSADELGLFQLSVFPRRSAVQLNIKVRRAQLLSKILDFESEITSRTTVERRLHYEWNYRPVPKTSESRE